MKKYMLPVISILISFVCLITGLAKGGLEPPVGWLSGELTTLENTAPFNQRCTHCFDYYTDTADFMAASKLMYDETGVQLYLVDMEVNCTENNIKNDYDMYNYVIDYIEENIETDNAVVIYNCYQEEDNLTDANGNYLYMSLYDQLYIGESAGKVLRSDALTIFNNSMYHFRYSYGGTQYSDTVKLFLNHTKYTGICKSKLAVSSMIWYTPILVLLVINIVVIVKRRKHADTVEILSAPLEKLYDDELVDKYTK